MDFKRKYPLQLQHILITPMIFRENVLLFRELPYPTLNGIRDLAEYAGFSYSAVRTALSRVRAKGEIDMFKDEKGKIRYSLTEIQKSVSRVVSNQKDRPEGFILAVFSFRKDDEKERYVARETLRYYGFKRLAQNTYINGLIDTKELTSAIRKYGLDKNLYIFKCPDIEEGALKDKILEIFDLKRRVLFLNQFNNDLYYFFSEENISEDECARRYLYAGPVHYLKCFVDEPPFPARFLPEDYPLNKIEGLIKLFSTQNRDKIIRYYIKINN